MTLDRLESEMREDRVYRIGGIVTAANHGKDKNGNGYCKVKIQDYKGELELFIAREKYYSFRGYLEVGQIVFMELENKRRYQGGSLFVEVKQISLLSSLSEKYVKGIKLRIGLDQLDECLLTDLYTLVSQNKGKHNLRLILVDEQDKMEIELESYPTKVEVNSAFVEELNRLSIQYRLN
jgi:DNA polymerase-3 subunit alpha